MTNKNLKSGDIIIGNIIRGIGVSPGIRIAKACIVRRRKINVKADQIESGEINGEVTRFYKAANAANDHLEALKTKLNRKRAESHYLILEAHQMMLKDELFSDQIIKYIKDHQFSAEWALQITIEKLKTHFSNMEDELFKRRANDIADVGQRVMEHLTGTWQRGLENIKSDAILTAHNITPGDATHFYTNPINGFALEVGGRASHIAIIARSMEIPAVLGLKGLLKNIKENDTIIIDGYHGVVIVNPSQEQLAEYNEREASYSKLLERLHKGKDEPAITKDGVQIVLKGNIESVEEIPSLEQHGAEGIGLFRTEFIYMDRMTAPSEEEQYEYYKRIISGCKCGSSTIRTLDSGGDKLPAYWPYQEENNPALGYRAVRTIAGNERYFIDQIRAIYRAAVHGEAKLLLPFISGLGELEQVCEILDQVKKDLRHEKIEFDPNVPLGVMIELPSAAVMSDLFAKRVDFFSIGTNDLIQYTLAVDRDSEELAYLYNPLNPAILRLIKLTADNAKAANIDVALCGQMASDAMYTLLLIGLGVTELDMPAASIPYVKEVIRSSTIKEGRDLVQKVINCATALEVEKIVFPEMLERHPDLFEEQ